MDVISIRSALPSDAASLLAIYAPYVEKTAISFEYQVPSICEFEARIRKTLEKYPYLVAHSGKEILGYAYASPFKGRRAYDWAVESSVYIRRENRRGGIGRLLYAELEKRLSQMGICNLYACIAASETPDETLDDSSLLFHRRMGFSEAGRFHRCGCKFGRWYDSVWMEKMLKEHPEHPDPPSFPR